VVTLDDGRLTALGTTDRRELLDLIALCLPEACGRASLWPGDNLGPPPASPVTMPYQPQGT
jgi:hypothetical protein